MQVFMPYPDVESSVAVLDSKRLGNQIYREGLILVRGGWPNHPVSKIWTPHRHALAYYCLCGLNELSWRGRWYPRWYAYFGEQFNLYPDTGLPPLTQREDFNASHRSQLLKKDFGWYSQFKWSEKPGELEYVWE